MSKSVIIVGAGISGLSAGFYSQLNGFQTTIYESHNIPGGLCTAWKRKGYTFDISMHMVTGSRSGPLHQIWKELGVAGNFTFHYHHQALQVEGMGKKLTYTNDRKKLENDMVAISPEDAPLLREYVKLIFGCNFVDAASLKPYEIQNVFDKLKTLPYILPVIPKFMKYKSATIQDFANRFKDPFLRVAVRFFIDAPGWPMPKFPLAIMTGFMKSSVSEAGTPLGGSQKVVLHIAKMVEQLGGVINYETRVDDLIIENEQVKGVVLEDGTEKRADLVIWAGDGHTLIFNILSGKYVDETIKKMYSKWIPVRPVLHVMIGVNRDLSEEPHKIVFQPDEPITIAGEEHKWLTVIHHCFDKTMAPAGKSAVEVWYDTDYDYWEALSKHREEYEAEKQRIADYTIAQLEKRWKGFAGQVEVIDIPTPATYNRYTGNWKGSPDGWYITSENWTENLPVRNLPGLQDLYMVGQWTAPFTGTIIAAQSGRQIIQLLCKKEGKKFRFENNLL
ncbi:MAG: phytoene dehydrogenase-like [Prolixibacteraceae bacterium]|nr:MAG: phytoene dehydrogenase-like [Prolixibacteraceae bacterium]